MPAGSWPGSLLTHVTISNCTVYVNMNILYPVRFGGDLEEGRRGHSLGRNMSRPRRIEDRPWCPTRALELTSGAIRPRRPGQVHGEMARRRATPKTFPHEPARCPAIVRHTPDRQY